MTTGDQVTVFCILFLLIGFVSGMATSRWQEEPKVGKSFWNGYKRGVEDERMRAAEAMRPLASRIGDGPLVFGKSWDELTKGKPTP